MLINLYKWWWQLPKTRKLPWLWLDNLIFVVQICIYSSNCFVSFESLFWIPSHVIRGHFTAIPAIDVNISILKDFNPFPCFHFNTKASAASSSQLVFVTTVEYMQNADEIKGDNLYDFLVWHKYMSSQNRDTYISLPRRYQNSDALQDKKSQKYREKAETHF